VGEYEWRRAEQPVLVKLTDPVAVTMPAVVTMTAWRNLPEASKPFLRVIDLSRLVGDMLPYGSPLQWLVCLDPTLNGCVCLEEVVLPRALRELPMYFFSGCWRLASIDTRYTALEVIGEGACDGCKSLVAFVLPPTFRGWGDAAFEGTSITTLDLSGTAAEKVRVCGMVSLVDLVLPRRCVLEDVRSVPSLRRVTFGASMGVPSLRRVTFAPYRYVSNFDWHPAEVRFESLAADAEFSPGLLEARVYGVVACEMGCETLPFPPP
jgi:hypothetical protein